MKKNTLRTLTIACQLFLITLVAGAQQSPLTLWYITPSQKWTDALPIGNGRLGAMIYGGINEEHLQFNEETLWTGKPRAHAHPGAVQYLQPIRELLFAGKQKEAEALAEKEFMGLRDSSDNARGYQADYQPFGDIHFRLFGAAEASAAATDNYKRQLDIRNAIASLSYTSTNIHFTREYFASAPQQCIAIQFASSTPRAINVEASLATPHKEYVLKRLDNNTLSISLKVSGGALKGVAYLYVQAPGAEIKTTGNNITVLHAGKAIFYLVAATNFISYTNVSGDPVQKCTDALARIKALSYETIKANHIRDYQQLFNRFTIQLPGGKNSNLPTDERIRQFNATDDAALIALYMQYGRYLLIASSRSGTQPANLQGIWNDQLSPPWGSKYTSNINVEMNYWPAESLNLSACAQPLFQMIKELHVAGAATAKEQYGAPGWVLHHNTDLWRGTAPINASNHGIWVTGAAWLCHHIWDHYLFTQDKQFLQQYYPVMKDAARFFQHTLVKDPVTGWLISTPSNSPEQGGLVAGPTMDHQIIRDLFKNCISAATVLNTDAAFSNQLVQTIKQIAPNKIGRLNQLQEWMQDVDDSSNRHRHVSHLWGVYPGTDITWKDSTMMQAARQSLLYRGDGGTGWSLAWKVNLWARFKDGDHALKILNALLSPAEDPNGGKNERGGVYHNLFDAHPPFQIDGNFGGAAGIGEMLVQSQGDAIELLPALPTALPEGAVSGICARGGFVLDIEWSGGKLKRVTITSKTGKQCRLRYGNKENVFIPKAGLKYVFDGALIAGQEPAGTASTREVSESVMQKIYDEIKTPFKYGLVLAPENDSRKVDCPSVFRQGNSWYMTYIVFDGRGYETWLAQSNDLLHWSPKGRLLSFSPDTTRWDANQKAGYIALQEPAWGGSYQLQQYNNNYWMSYIGGREKGYEAGALSIGIASTQQSPIQVHEWSTQAVPVLTSTDADVRWWENQKEFKSTIIWDKKKTTGYPFVMYYNANGDSAKSNIKTRWFERIGMAVSNDMQHWKRFHAEPVMHHPAGITGDAVIQKIGDVWVMFYFGAFWTGRNTAFNRFACSYDLVNWTDWQGDDLISASEPYDERFAHKPFLVKHNGIVYHFYCAVNKKDQRGIAVATSVDMGKSNLLF